MDRIAAVLPQMSTRSLHWWFLHTKNPELRRGIAMELCKRGDYPQLQPGMSLFELKDQIDLWIDRIVHDLEANK